LVYAEWAGEICWQRHWNDPDMLEVGNGLPHDESVTHMSLWAILAAPLLAGNDLSTMTLDTISVLANKEVVAVDQDALARQGHRLSEVGHLDIWVRDLSNGDKVIGLFNRGVDAHELHFRAESVGWKKARARDLWKHEDLGVLPDNYSILIPRRGAVMLRISQIH
jgi:alpha-galactosidase